jgi:hypothetical protein
VKFVCTFFNVDTDEIKEVAVLLTPDEVRTVHCVRASEGDANAHVRAQALALKRAYAGLRSGFVHVYPPKTLPASPLEDFLSEMRAEPVLAGDIVDDLEAVLQRTKTEARTNSHAQSFLKAVAWIASHTDRSIVERLTQLQRLTSFEGPVVMSMTAFTGWT